MEKVIITGADGFIGSHLVKEFLEHDIEVWVVIYPESKTKNQIPKSEKVHRIECEIADLRVHKSEFPLMADAFYHFAWQGVNADDRNDFELQMTNIEMSLECIKFASKIKAQKFILPGSTSEYLYYGKSINRDALPSPQNAYGSVKVALRYLASQCAAQYGVNFIYTVITGIYATDRRDNNVIFYTINKLLDNEKPSLTKLEQLWDYVNIEDVTRALFLIGEKGKNDAFYAIGHGDNWPLYEYIDIIHKYIGEDIPLGIGDVPYNNDVLPSSCIDLTEIYNDTGFVPQIDYEQGIKTVIDTMREEKDR